MIGRSFRRSCAPFDWSNELSMNFATRALRELKEATRMAARAVRGLFKRPRYIPEIIAQMDAIGVGSLTIIILTGFFTGGVLTVQTFPTLKAYGAQSQTGYLVAVSLVRELGPVLCALMVTGHVGALPLVRELGPVLCALMATGRVGSATSAELGSMVVSQQIDAMRALGTDPVRKLVAPRLFALLVSLPLLTVLADVMGIFGGWVTAVSLYSISSSVFITAVRDGITVDDLIGGVVKPLAFSII